MSRSAAVVACPLELLNLPIHSTRPARRIALDHRHTGPAAALARPSTGVVRRALGMLVVAALAMTGVLFGAAAPARAATIFSDDFTAGLGGWTNQLWVADAGTARSGADVLGGWSSLLRSIDTGAYQNVRLEFDYEVSGLSPQQALVVSARPNAGVAFSQVASYTANSGGWQSASFDISGLADLEAAFQLQFALIQTPAGPPPGGWSVRIDNVELTGDLDVTAPTITLVTPPAGSAIPHTVSMPFTVAVSDDYSAPADVDVRYRFISDVDPSVSYDYAWGVLNGTTTRTSNLSGSSFSGWLGLTTGQSFTWIVDARDTAGNLSTTTMGTYYYNALPAPGAPVITSGALPDGEVGVPYDFTVTATGDAPLSFSATGLPAGLSIHPTTGAITGTPTTAGPYSVAVTVSNAALPAATRVNPVMIAPSAAGAAPLIISGPMPNGEVGVPYSHTIVATGDAPLVFSAAGLPPGLSINAASGLISGTPVVANPHAVLVTVSNGILLNAVRTYSITVHPAGGPPSAPTITSGSMPGGEEFTAYSFAVVATGSAPLTYSATGLPLGVSIAASTGIISGTPTVAGNYFVQLTVSNGTAPDATQFHTVVIAGPIRIIAAAPPDGTVGTAYSYPVDAAGPGVLEYSATGLPPGLTIDAASGVISGNPSLDGTFPITITVANGGVSTPRSAPAAIVIAPAPPGAIQFLSAAPAGGTVGVPYSHPVATDAGPGGLAFTLLTGVLPPGLALDPLTGAISGTPTAAGAWTFTLNVSDGVRPDGQATYTITIAPAATGGGGAGPAELGTTGMDAAGPLIAAALLLGLGLLLILAARAGWISRLRFRNR